MEASSTIQKMMAGNKVFVPTYQRAYSWDTETDSKKPPKQVNTFLTDLEEFNRSKAAATYYFGHFLFEKRDERFGIIDGQQRLTTIVIFLSALLRQLKEIRELKDEEKEAYEDIVKRNSTYRFETVDYDDQLFKDYVIKGGHQNHGGLETESAKRIVRAYDFFVKQLKGQDATQLENFLRTVRNASCSTRLVSNESEAIQMFIFQNNRGKRPSNLEVIKAQFLFNVHLYAGEEKDELIKEIKNRFEGIYKSISSIEYSIDEDDVLLYTLRIYFRSLWESNATERVNRALAEDGAVAFIQSFTQLLELSFKYLMQFFGKDEREHIEIHSLVKIGGIGLAVPFIIKSYMYGVGISEICKLCSSLGSLLLRHRLIGTRADLTSRLNDVFENYKGKEGLEKVVARIEWMKKLSNDQWWWSYWNHTELERSVQRGIHHSTAKYLLWKYENHLEKAGRAGYVESRYDVVVSPELEHIAPRTPTNGEPIAAGYCEYDEEFREQYIDCLGNYLLLSESHNRSLGNKPFAVKLESYKELKQHLELQEFTKGAGVWGKEQIKKRKEKIVKFILDTF